MNAGTATRAKARMDQYLAAFGVSATWKRRTAAVPDSGSAISSAFGHGDPVDAGYLAPLDDTDLWTDGGTILVAFEAPANRQDIAAGQMISGMGTAHVATEHAVKASDVLVIDGEVWIVDGATPLMASRNITLRRQGVA